MIARAALLCCLAQPVFADPMAAIEAFGAHCFSPLLTSKTARDRLSVPGARIDFYDLRPFSDAAPSLGRGEIAPETDRRCEVAFDGDHTAAALPVITEALAREGITERVPYLNEPLDRAGIALIEARCLNPNRMAVVTLGTREGPMGLETFLNVERLTPRPCP